LAKKVKSNGRKTKKSMLSRPTLLGRRSLRAPAWSRRPRQSGARIITSAFWEKKSSQTINNQRNPMQNKTKTKNERKAPGQQQQGLRLCWLVLGLKNSVSSVRACFGKNWSVKSNAITETERNHIQICFQRMAHIASSHHPPNLQTRPIPLLIQMNYGKITSKSSPPNACLKLMPQRRLPPHRRPQRCRPQVSLLKWPPSSGSDALDSVVVHRGHLW